MKNGRTRENLQFDVRGGGYLDELLAMFGMITCLIVGMFLGLWIVTDARQVEERQKKHVSKIVRETLEELGNIEREKD
jgi:uncharacterized protein YneF (UPF0154 family)